MKKILFLLSWLLPFFWFFPQNVDAHPLDISSTVLFLGDSSLAGTTYFHSYEISTLLGKLGKDVTEVGTYIQHKDDILQYFRDHLEIRNDGQVCSFSSVDIPEQEWYQILSKGLAIEYSLQCPTKLQSLGFHITFFTDFPLQTNRLSLLGEKGDEVFFRVGTVEIQTLQYVLGQNVARIDSDNDGIDDEEEHAYQTDPNNRDTDGDYYLDGEEVNNGWLPTNPNPSPWQTIRTSYPEQFLLQPTRDIVQWTGSAHPAIPKKDYSLLGNSVGSETFQSILRRIGQTISGEQKTAFPLIFLFTVFLGFLHALGPWHAKWLLSGIMVHKKASFFSGMRFILIFSVTHILDILLLFLVLKFFLHYFDPGILLAAIQKVSSIILLGLWVYLLYCAFFWKWDQEEENFSQWKITLLAIIAGLAPCSFGWSLFFMLISLGKIDWVFPLIFALALGIFLCLFLILCVIYYTKKQSYSRISSLSQYSVKLSALLIFAIGLYLTKSNFI